jgi:hypothetical protein
MTKKSNKSTLLLKVFLGTAFIASSFLLSSFNSVKNPNEGQGVFTYMVNDKVFTLENMTAVIRTTTGGKKQLSLSNDRFVKFFFIDPQVKNFDLSSSSSKDAIVRYNEPGTNNIFVPRSGHVTITKLDENSKMLSGEFEMELWIPGKDKIIKIKKGQFNCPIVVLR